jgi:hypothetical protein
MADADEVRRFEAEFLPRLGEGMADGEIKSRLAEGAALDFQAEVRRIAAEFGVS